MLPVSIHGERMGCASRSRSVHSHEQGVSLPAIAPAPDDPSSGLLREVLCDAMISAIGAPVVYNNHVKPGSLHGAHHIQYGGAVVVERNDGYHSGHRGM